VSGAWRIDRRIAADGPSLKRDPAFEFESFIAAK
jgi:hypothetical protein